MTSNRTGLPRGRPKSPLGDVHHNSPRHARLLRFFKRKPAPSRFEGETEDGDEIVCAVPDKPGHAAWVDCLSVLRLCTHIKAFDASGATLRAIDMDPNDPELRQDAERESTEASERQMSAETGAGRLPVISVDIPKLVDNIARNIREVASEAATQNSIAFKEGFTALVQCVNVCLNVLVSVEERLSNAEALANEREASLLAGAAPAPNAKDQLALMALQKAIGGGAPTNGAPSGIDMTQLMQLAQSYMAMNKGEEPPP